jgi:hypothetical protein
MPQCFATTRTQNQCSRFGSQQGLCKTHAEMPEWQAERTRRLTQNVVHETAAAAATETEVPILVPPRPTLDLAIVEAARRERIAIERREAHTAKLHRWATLSPVKVMQVADAVAAFWVANSVPGYDLMKAYAALKHVTTLHPGYEQLYAAVIHVLYRAKENDPLDRNYADIPQDELTPLYAAVATALHRYHDRLLELVRRGDPYLNPLRLRVQQEREAELRRVAEVEQAARQAQLRIDLEERVVVFRRDPSGGVDLRAMAADHESVHRESVQTTTQRAVTGLLVRPLPSDQDTLGEVVTAFHDSSILRWDSEASKQALLAEVAQDYLDGKAFGVRYGDVMDRVWAFIRSHTHRNDLIFRLVQELSDGRRTCTNGKMARLINTLQGYDDTLTMDPPREVFQEQIARLSSRPVGERTTEVRRLFEEYRIPVGEQAPWLEALELA